MTWKVVLFAALALYGAAWAVFSVNGFSAGFLAGLAFCLVFEAARLILRKGP